MDVGAVIAQQERAGAAAWPQGGMQCCPCDVAGDAGGLTIESRSTCVVGTRSRCGSRVTVGHALTSENKPLGWQRR